MSNADTGEHPAAHPEHPTVLAAVVLARLVLTRQLSAHEVVEAHLGSVQSLNGALNAVVRVDAEEALRVARRIDDAVSHGRPVGPLAGVPFVVKDNIDVHGHETASGSRAHHGVVAMADAPVVRHLREAGAILLGRANRASWPLRLDAAPSHGPTRNPVDRRRSPGGSSGGARPRSRPGSSPSQWAPTRAGRSANRPRSAGCSAWLPPTASSPWTA